MSQGGVECLQRTEDWLLPLKGLSNSVFPDEIVDIKLYYVLSMIEDEDG